MVDPMTFAIHASFVPPGASLKAVVTDRAGAEAALRNQAVDVVVVVPPDVLASFKAGKQSTVTVEYNLINPAKADYATVLAQELSYALNQQLIEGAAAAASSALPSGVVAPIPPKVIAAPTRAQPRNLAPTQPNLTSFFGPAILALILQHLAITLAALSLIRERKTGVLDILRVSPVSAFEIIVGKVIAFGLLGAVLALVLVAALTGPLGVPNLGDPSLLVASISLLILASIGVGVLISVVSDSDRQAVQLALLLLLASIFFSGLLLDLQQFAPVVRIVGYLLPVTHGISLLQDLMLRGSTNEPWHFAALGVIAGVSLVATWVLLRRGMSVRT